MKVNKKVLITGGNGYLGGELIKSFIEKGYSISLLSSSINKNNFNDKIDDIFTYNLGEDIDESIFKNVHVFIHCAYDFNVFKWNEIYEQNVLGSKKIFISAKNSGVKHTIFISSISAFDGCISMYGNAKLQMESHALELGFKVLRPGVLFGNSSQGLIGRLRMIAVNAPLIPLVGRGRQELYTIHIDDLILFIFLILDNKVVISKATVVAFPQPYSFKEILINLTDDSKKQGKTLFIMIPPLFILYGLKLLEFLKINTGFRSDSLISLLNTPKNIDFEAMKKSAINFKKL